MSNILFLIDFPAELRNCCGKHCNNESYKHIINNLYSNIINILCSASMSGIKVIKIKNRKVVAGWNHHVRDSFSNAREKLEAWVWNKKPTCGPIFETMVQT